VALGALIIQEKLGLTDEETVAQIQENPYLQYFVGNEGYRDEKPFDSSMMGYFRKRLEYEELNGINELVHEKHGKKGSEERVGHVVPCEVRCALGNVEFLYRFVARV
jgi:hypothetical protein